MAVPTINTANYLNTAKAAAQLEVDVDTVRRYCANYEWNLKNPDHVDWPKTPEIQGVQVGRSWMIHKRTLKNFLASRNRQGRPKAG